MNLTALRRSAERATLGPKPITPERMRLHRWLAAGIIVILLALVIAVQLRGASTVVTSQRSGASTAPPLAFAENCLALSVASQGATSGTPEAEEFSRNCQPGVDIPADEGEGGLLQSASEHAFADPELTVQDPDDPRMWSVYTVAQLRAWNQRSGWVSRGVAYYRVPVLKVGSTMTLRGLPRRVAWPLAADPPAVDAGFGAPDFDDPRTAVVQTFLTRYLKAPPPNHAGEGDVTNYTTGWEDPALVHDPYIRRVEVTGINFTPNPRGVRVLDADVQILVTYLGGVREHQQVGLTLENVGDTTWQVAEFRNSPRLEIEP